MVFTEFRTWESDELMDVVEAIEETAKPRIPAKVSMIEYNIIRQTSFPVCYDDYYDEWVYDDKYEVIETYRIG